jgi:hypothetical protein
MPPWALIDRDEQEDYLGVFGAVWNLVPAKLTSEVLGQCVSIYTWTAVSTSPTRILPINNSSTPPGSSSVLVHWGKVGEDRGIICGYEA